MLRAPGQPVRWRCQHDRDRVPQPRPRSQCYAPQHPDGDGQARAARNSEVGVQPEPGSEAAAGSYANCRPSRSGKPPQCSESGAPLLIRWRVTRPGLKRRHAVSLPGDPGRQSVLRADPRTPGPSGRSLVALVSRVDLRRTPLSRCGASSRRQGGPHSGQAACQGTAGRRVPAGREGRCARIVMLSGPGRPEG